MEDNILFDKGNYVFNYRVGTVIRKDNKILVQRSTEANHITIPGGRCQLNEDSIETAIRELKEETGYDFKFVRAIAIIENFFKSEYNHKNYHELLFIHELEPIDKSVLDKQIVNIEPQNKDNLTYEWIDIDKLIENNYKPEIIVDLLKNNRFQHIINKD